MQKPHPPLCFAFTDPTETKDRVDEYYDIIKSDKCVPIGHTVNASIMVTSFSVHHDQEEDLRRGEPGFDFLKYALADAGYAEQGSRLW